MTKQTLSSPEIDEIEARANAATDGPWTLHEDDGDTFRAPAWEVLLASGETVARVRDWASADAEFIAHAPEDVRALLDEVRRLRAERDKFCNRVDTLTAVAKGNKRHVQEMFRELQKARAALEGIRHLHKDSPMGPCPVCIDADAITAGGDGLMPYPCPTGRLAGAQDCDPPPRPAPAPAASAGDGQQQ